MKPYYSLTTRGRARRLRKLAINALKCYDLDVDRISLVTNATNGIFRVDTCSGEKWILRVTLPEGGHTYDHVAAEMDFLSALARDTYLNVPRPLAAQDGRLVVQAGAEGVPEERMCAIFRWVPGRDLAARMTPANMRRLGELSARLHRYACLYRPPAGLEILAFDRLFPFPEPVILFERAYEDLFTPGQRLLYRQAADRVQMAIELLQASGEPMRIIHGDLHQWNVRCTGNLFSPIDFEDLMWGWPVQDIAVTLYYSHGRPDYAALRPAFEQGYRDICAWPERYDGEIDTFIAARGLGLLNFVLNDCLELGVDLAKFAAHIENRLRLLLD